jgi:hypothetical protein
MSFCEVNPRDVCARSLERRARRGVTSFQEIRKAKENKMAQRKIVALAVLLSSSWLCCLAATSAYADDEVTILKHLTKVSTLASTIPSNGDVNPYGVFEIKRTTGDLTKGDILVSNFNNSMNQQGTGTTIVEVAPNGSVTQFAQISASAVQNDCPGGVGLTTALVVLRSGWVIVGSLPTSDGTSSTAQGGCLIVLDNMGNVAETFFGSLINGPWDMTVEDGDHEAKLFVTNVLNGTVMPGANAMVPGTVVNTATVLRIDLCVSESNMPSIESMTVIGSGFPARTDPNALVLGPTGVFLSPVCEADDDCAAHDEVGRRVLYVADTLNNRIAVITDPLTRTDSAGTGFTLTSGGSLNSPLGLTVAPNGHILTVNGNDGYVTEITSHGHQIAKTLLDDTMGTGTPPPPPGDGALFGVIFDADLGLVFVDDDSNSLDVLGHP